MPMTNNWFRSLRRLALATALLLATASLIHAADSLPAENPKYRVAKKIYDDIARAFGDGRLPPRLVLSPEGVEQRLIVAWSDPGNGGDIGITGSLGDAQEGYIAVEERVYDLFARPGRDLEGALAFILGHELAHYYLRHGWAGDFGNSFASLDMGKKMLKAASLDEVMRRETEADYFGGFYGFLAGYDTLGSAPKVIDVLYAEYKLPDKIPSYPSRLERRAIAERAGINLRKMVPLFEGANRLLLLKQYPEAARLYNHLARAFPSREMFNNAGVAYALEALSLFRPGTLGYAYPFEFDAETRLLGKSARGKGLDQDKERRNRLLQKAADAFDQALARDREYAVAKVNLAAVNSLLGDNDTALVLANQALELAKRQGEELTLANAQVARGIAYAATGNRERAQVDFAVAGNSGNRLAALNLALMAGEKPPVRLAAAEEKLPVRLAGAEEKAAPREEVIAGISSHAPFPKDKDVVTFTLQGSAGGEPALTLYSRRGEGWERNLALIGGRMVNLVATIKGYPGESARGIALGSASAAVREKYGAPARTVTARQSTWYVYDKSGIAFAIDQSGQVAGWLLFSID